MTSSRPPAHSKRARRFDAQTRQPAEIEPAPVKRSWLPDPVETVAPPAPFTVATSRRRSYSTAAASIGVVAVVVALVVVMATSASMLGKTGAREETGAGTPADPSKRLDAPSSTTERATATSELAPIAEAVAPMLGDGWISMDSGEVDPADAPPVGAGCAPAPDAVRPTSAYGRTWSHPQTGSETPGQVVVRVASFARPEHVTADLLAERDLAAVVCSKASLNAYRPGTAVSVADPIPVDVGVDSVGYRMVSVGGDLQVAAVTDIFVVGVGHLQGTVTMSRCCEGWDPVNEHTVLAALLQELAEAQGLAVDDEVARTAGGTPLAG